MYKKIIAYVLVIVIIISVCSTFALAFYIPPTISKVLLNYADILMPNSLSFGEYFQWLQNGKFDSYGCPAVDGGLHQWHSDLLIAVPMGRFEEKCLYCGMYATDYLNELESAKVSTLDKTTITNNGLFTVYPIGWEFDWSGYSKQYLPNTSLTSYNGGFEYSGVALADISSRYATVYSDAFELPKGSYRLDLTAHSEGSGYGSMSTSWTLYIQGSDDMINWSDIGCATDSVLVGSYTYRPLNFSTIDHDFKYYRCYAYFVSYNGVKAGSIASGKREGHITCLALADADWTSSDTTPESRPVSLMQTINNYNTENNYVDNSVVNYYIGTVDSAGEVSEVYNPNIYDENTKVFTEPVSGAQIITTGWSYNYLTRSYDMTVADGAFSIGDTAVTRIVCTYGDENVTISYYASDSTIIQTDEFAYVAVAKDECTLAGHSYTYETIKEASCTEYGERKYTCSRCGNEYAEEVPLSEHTYKVEEKVNTEYGEDGSITVYGYTRYKCEDCGAEKVENDQVDVTNESWFKWLGTQLRKLGSALVGGLSEGLEYLTGTVIKSVTDWSLGLVEWLFGLVDGELLNTWYSWFNEDNPYIKQELEKDGTEVGSIWA